MVAELSNSLGQISLQSDTDNSRNITEYIIGAKDNLEKVLKMLLVKKPMILNDLSPNTGNCLYDKYFSQALFSLL